MREIASILFSGAIATTAAQAQDALTYSFEGRVGLGYLSHTAANPDGFGYGYDGAVFQAEGTGKIEFLLIEDIRIGAIARLSLQKGIESNYDRLLGTRYTPGGGDEFGGTNFDLAIYAALPSVTLSYGKMETAFDFATLEVRNGGSILDGGNAVWMNIGDGSGSTGYRGEVSEGPGIAQDFYTLRADVSLGDFTLSASKSSQTASIGASAKVESAGVIWSHDFDGMALIVGAGYDKGPQDRFNSLSVGVTAEGLNLVLSRIQRKPLTGPSIGSSGAFDTTYFGTSISYDFGALTVGIAQSRQESPPGVLVNRAYNGKARAIWASWEVRENITIDAEWSQSDYFYERADDNKKASLAVSLDF
jgi:hypothetical protein